MPEASILSSPSGSPTLIVGLFGMTVSGVFVSFEPPPPLPPAPPAAPTTAAKPSVAAHAGMSVAAGATKIAAVPSPKVPISPASKASSTGPSWVMMVCPTNSPPKDSGASKIAKHWSSERHSLQKSSIRISTSLAALFNSNTLPWRCTSISFGVLPVASSIRKYFSPNLALIARRACCSTRILLPPMLSLKRSAMMLSFFKMVFLYLQKPPLVNYKCM